MDLSQLKNTNDEQFKKDISFDVEVPESGGEVIELTIKSVRNPEIRPRFTMLYKKTQTELAKLDKANITDDQAKSIGDKVTELEKKNCELVFVGFSGLMDGDKPFANNKTNRQFLLDNFEWVRQAITQKTSDADAFYTV